MRNPSGNRCVICDWSPSNDQSNFNPKVAEYGSNVLKICPHTGDMICRMCEGVSSSLNRIFKIYNEKHTTFENLKESARDLSPVRTPLGEGNFRRRPVRYE